MSEKEAIEYDIERIDNAIDNLYSAKDEILDVDDTDKEYEIMSKTIDLLEQLKIKKEQQLIHEKGIKVEYV